MEPKKHLIDEDEIEQEDADTISTVLLTEEEIMEAGEGDSGLSDPDPEFDGGGGDFGGGGASSDFS